MVEFADIKIEFVFNILSPTAILVTFKPTLSPTLITVGLSVDGNLFALIVPVVIFDAFEAKLIAFEYA